MRSMPAYVYGVTLVALGLALVVSESTPLYLAQTLSVAALVAGLIVLVAIIATNRARNHDDEAGSV